MECVKEFLAKDDNQGKIYKKGLLVHYALTRVPANERTELEVEKMAETSITRQMDAESIIGKEEAEKIEEAVQAVGKSQTELVTFSEADDMEDEIPEDTEEEDKACNKKKKTEKSEVSEGELEIPSNRTVSKRLYKSKGAEAQKADVTMESETVDTQVEETVDIKEVVRSVMSEELAKIQKSEHPLDKAYATFCSAYDEVIKANHTPEERLQALQESFNALAEEIKSVVNAIPQTDEEKGAVELSSVVAKAIAPLMDEINLLKSQIRPVAENTEVPQRRNLQPPSNVTINNPSNNLPVQKSNASGALTAKQIAERTT